VSDFAGMLPDEASTPGGNPYQRDYDDAPRTCDHGCGDEADCGCACCQRPGDDSCCRGCCPCTNPAARITGVDACRLPGCPALDERQAGAA
jgi:hypothetical protein